MITNLAGVGKNPFHFGFWILVTYNNQMMAVSLLALVPILIVFFFTQKQFIQGIALTGIKG
jgi:ABC-type glycerol-3-phosphate transport system permease component